MNVIHVRSLGNSTAKKIEMVKTVNAIKSNTFNHSGLNLTEQQIKAAREAMRRFA